MNEVDDIRLKEFRQLKKEIRGSKEYLIVGIDVAKEKHYAFFGTATGKTLLRRLIFDNTIEGFGRLLNQVDAIQVTQGLPKVVFGLEPTVNYHKPLGEQERGTLGKGDVVSELTYLGLVCREVPKEIRFQDSKLPFF